MSHRLVAVCGILIVALRADTAGAQQITVQQPVIGTFSTATTVSVPDRGRAILGGVGRSASGRSSYGPFRSGTNTGRATEGSNVSVHVRIHDFAELDRQSLNSTTLSRNRRDDVKLPDQAEHAFRVLQSRSAARRK